PPVQRRVQRARSGQPPVEAVVDGGDLDSRDVAELPVQPVDVALLVGAPGRARAEPEELLVPGAELRQARELGAGRRRTGRRRRGAGSGCGECDRGECGCRDRPRAGQLDHLAPLWIETVVWMNWLGGVPGEYCG